MKKRGWGIIIGILLYGDYFESVCDQYSLFLKHTAGKLF